MNSTQTLKDRFKYLLPVPVKKFLKFALYSLEDLASFATGKNKEGYPPKRLNFVGSAEFKKVGDEFASLFRELGGLRSTDTVLDIGSGIGRMDIPLIPYLGSQGALFGFDIDRRGVEWCQRHLSPQHPNFHFETVDLYNQYYNRKGTIQAEHFRFPYADETFDFAFATSVFTHMLPDQVTQYLSEIRRVLKKGGKCFLTFFSIDEEAERNIQSGLSHCDLSIPFGEGGFCFYSHKNVPEAEIGFKESWIVRAMDAASLGQGLQIHHGSWANRQKSVSYQDLFVGQKSN
jgi:SAM-dependent methyltransferase